MATEIKVRGQEKPILLSGYVWAAKDKLPQGGKGQILAALGNYVVHNLCRDSDVSHGTEIASTDGRTLHKLEPGQSITGEALSLQLIEYIKCLPYTIQ